MESRLPVKLKGFEGYSGKTFSSHKKSYPYLIILQNADQIVKSLNDVKDKKETSKFLGGLVIYSKNGLFIKDVSEVFEGVLLRAERGSEMWAGNKCVHSSKETIGDSQKEFLIKKYGEFDDNQKIKNEPKNVYKLLFKAVTPIELTNGEIHNYFMVTLKGNSYFQYQDLEEKQSIEIVNSPDVRGTNVDTLPLCFWKVKISTKEKENTRGGSSYVFDFLPELMSVEDAKSYLKDLNDSESIEMIPEASGVVLDEASVVDSKVAEPDIEYDSDEKYQSSELDSQRVGDLF